MKTSLRNTVCIVGLAFGLSFAAVGNIAQAAETIPCPADAVPAAMPGEEPAACEMFIVRAQPRESVVDRLSREYAAAPELPALRFDTIDVFEPTTVLVSVTN